MTTIFGGYTPYDDRVTIILLRTTPLSTGLAPRIDNLNIILSPAVLRRVLVCPHEMSSDYANLFLKGGLYPSETRISDTA